MKNPAGWLFLTFGLMTLFPTGRVFAAELSGIFMEEPRKQLEEKGISFEASYLGDMVANMQGGLHEKTTYIGSLDFALTVDFEQTGLIPGGKFFISGNESHGGENPTAKHIGDLQGVDNIEALDSIRLYEWWYEQSLWDDKFSILAGIHGLDSEFAISTYGCVFIHSSFGTPPDITANVPNSAFPAVGPAVRIKIKPHEQFEFLAGLYDGDPTDSGTNHHNVNYRLSSRQGLMALLEGAYYPGIKLPGAADPLPGSIKVGSWLHTADTDDVLAFTEAGEPVRHRNDYGFYGIIDQMLFREKKGADGPVGSLLCKILKVRSGSVEEENTEQGLGVFFQFGGAPDDRNTVDYYFGAGLHYTGLFPNRDRDILGIAVANAFLSERMQKARDLEIEAYDPTDPDAGELPGELLSHESALEVTYRIQIHDRLALQPDYQIVFHPSGEQNIKTAHVFILRFEVSY